MKYLIIILLFASSCITVDKAILKVNSSKLTDSQRRAMANYCDNEFSVEEKTTEGTIRTDSTAFKKEIQNLQDALSQAAGDFSTLMKMIDSTNGENDNLNVVARQLKHRIDSMNLVLRIAKSGKIPCPDKLKTDSTIKKSMAAIEALQMEVKQIRKEKNEAEIKLDARDKTIMEKDIKITELKNEPDNYWKGFKVGAIVAAAVVIAGTIFLKFKSII